MTDDLVSRVLAAIQEREDKAKACVADIGSVRAGEEYADGSGTADRDDFPSYPWGSEQPELEYMAGPGHPDEVLRLCQAHRKIIDQYEAASGFGRRLALDHASAAGRLTALGLVLQTLAEGYGIEAGS